MKRNIMLLLFTAILTSSCSCLWDYEYIVKNDSSYDLAFFIRSSRDSAVVSLRPSDEFTFTTTHGVEAGGCPYFTEVQFTLDSVSMINENKDRFMRDLFSDETWKYEAGVYVLTATDKDFN